jgi:hypothetical protein
MVYEGPSNRTPLKLCKKNEEKKLVKKNIPGVVIDSYLRMESYLQSTSIKAVLSNSAE